MLALDFGSKMDGSVRNRGRGIESTILFNNIIVGTFHFQRSIRQGCTLSPLCFAIFSHPLLIALDYSGEKGEIKGLILPGEK